MRLIFCLSIILFTHGCSIQNNRSENCVIKDSIFINKIFFNTDKFEDVVTLFLKKGYSSINTNEKISDNHLNNIIQLKKGNNVVSYIEGDASAFYAEICDSEIAFYHSIKIGNTIDDFIQKSGHDVDKSCNSVKLMDENGVGTITFYFKNNALNKVIVDFEVP